MVSPWRSARFVILSPFTNVPLVLSRSSTTNCGPSRAMRTWRDDTAELSITIVLSGRRPMVTAAVCDTAVSFNTRPSNKSTSLGMWSVSPSL